MEWGDTLDISDWYRFFEEAGISQYDSKIKTYTALSYATNFHHEGMTIKIITEITTEDFRELKITDINDAVKIKKYAVNLLQGIEKSNNNRRQTLGIETNSDNIYEKETENKAKKAEFEDLQKILKAKLKLTKDELGAKVALLEAAKDKLQKENIDNLVEFIEGNKVTKVSKKKKKRKTNKVPATTLNMAVQLLEENFATNGVAGGNCIVVDEHRCIEDEDLRRDEDKNTEELAKETISRSENIDDSLNENIERTIQLMRDEKKFGEELMQSKAKEMTRLLLAIDSAEDKKSNRMKEINHIDNQIKEMLKKKCLITEECHKHDEVKVQLEIKKSKLEEFISSNMVKSNTKMVQLESKLEYFRSKLCKNKTQIQPEQRSKEIHNIETPQQSNHQLLSYIDQQILSKESTLECPICLEVATTPIFMCEEQHLVCGGCRPRIQACPECRLLYTRNRRHRYAEISFFELQKLYQERDQLMG